MLTAPRQEVPESPWCALTPSLPGSLCALFPFGSLSTPLLTGDDAGTGGGATLGCGTRPEPAHRRPWRVGRRGLRCVLLHSTPRPVMMPDAMTDAARTPPDTAPVSLSDAAVRLGISPDAARKRLKRGTLRGEKQNGRWLVYLEPDARSDAVQDAAFPTVDAAPDAGVQSADATRTPPDAAADMAPLAELIERLARENAENRAAAALWQERARFLSERLAALEAGPLASQESAEAADAAQGANAGPLRDETREMAYETLSQGRAAPQPAGESLVRRWWRRMTRNE
jgi:hypothetical protein